MVIKMMKKTIICGFAAFLTFSLPSPSAAIEGLPGGTWASFNYDLHGLTGSGGMGWVNQGIDWVELPGEIMVNTYAEYSLRDRTKKETYYDARGPSVGIKFEKSYFNLGAEYYWTDYPKQNERDTGYKYTFGWYYSKDLKKKDQDLLIFNKIPAEGLPFSTWGKLSHDASGFTGSGGMGWIQQGIDWVTLPWDVTVNTYLKYSYRGRSKEDTYYDARGPSVGLELSKSYFSLGVSYFWEEFPVLNERHETAQIFAGWYYTWDLMEEE